MSSQTLPPTAVFIFTNNLRHNWINTLTTLLFPVVNAFQVPIRVVLVRKLYSQLWVKQKIQNIIYPGTIKDNEFPCFNYKCKL